MIEKKCLRCKLPFLPGSNRQILCKKCGKEAREHKIEPVPKVLHRQGGPAADGQGIPPECRKRLREVGEG